MSALKPTPAAATRSRLDLTMVITLAALMVVASAWAFWAGYLQSPRTAMLATAAWGGYVALALDTFPPPRWQRTR